MAELKCWNCGTSLEELPRPITRHMNCPACFEDLHCCRLCRHYRPNVTNPCDEDRAEPPVHKEGANFCEFFRPSTDAYEPSSTSKHAAAKNRLDALFSGESDGPESEADVPDVGSVDDAKRKLDDLFR